MRSLQLLICALFVCSTSACSTTSYRPLPPAEPVGFNGLDHEHAFTPADFGIPKDDGQFSRVQTLGQIAGYETETGLSYSTNGAVPVYKVLLSMHESPTSRDGIFEVTATAACEQGSSTEVTRIHPIAVDQTDVIAHCSGVPKAFSIQSIRFIPDLP